MADYEGYLLLHDGGRFADPLYFELEGGLLQYYTKKNGKWLGQLSFTRHRLIIRPVENGASPNRFTIDLTPVRSVHDTERSLKEFRRTKITLSASTRAIQHQWMIAMQTWRRRNWKDSVVIGEQEDEVKALRLIMVIHRLELKLTRSYDMTLRRLEMTPEESYTRHSSYSYEYSNKFNVASAKMGSSSFVNANRFSFHSGHVTEVAL